MKTKSYNRKRAIAKTLINNKARLKLSTVIIACMIVTGSYINLLNTVSDYATKQAEQHEITTAQLLDLHQQQANYIR